jgi:hypothetical protein
VKAARSVSAVGRRIVADYPSLAADRRLGLQPGVVLGCDVVRDGEDLQASDRQGKFDGLQKQIDTAEEMVVSRTGSTGGSGSGGGGGGGISTSTLQYAAVHSGVLGSFQTKYGPQFLAWILTCQRQGFPLSLPFAQPASKQTSRSAAPSFTAG